MGRLGIARTVAFEAAITAATSVNFDPNSINFQEYVTYLPTGHYGVQIWQNSIPSDVRPECTVNNGILNPFVVNQQADQVQDFSY
jgi:hypothetical protein